MDKISILIAEDNLQFLTSMENGGKWDGPVFHFLIFV